MLANLLNRRAGCVNRARPDLWGVWGASPIFTRWVDLTQQGGGKYFIHKLKIGPEFIILSPISATHPNELTIEDVWVGLIQCSGYDKHKIVKEISIINQVIKNLRTNIPFWTAVLKQYSIDMKLPYEAPEEFYYTKEMVKRKKEIDKGVFD